MTTRNRPSRALTFVFGGIVVAAAACTTSSKGGDDSCKTSDAIVATTDFSSSGLGAFAIDGVGHLTFGVDLGKDPVLASSGGRVFFIARDADVLFSVDLACGTAAQKLGVHDVAGSGTSNPQDVAVAPDGSLFIPRYNVASVGVYDAMGAHVREIDLSMYDTDGNPNANAANVAVLPAGPKIFVSLERLDDKNGFAVKEDALLVQIDVAAGTVDRALTLLGRNPSGPIADFGGAFFLAEPGDFASATEDKAGIERFDPQTGTSQIVATEKALGGSAVAVAITDGCAVAIVANAVKDVNATSIVRFDASGGAVGSASDGGAASDGGDGGTSPATMARGFGPTDGFDLSGLAWMQGGKALAVGDRRRSDKGYPVHIFERQNGCEFVMRPDTVFLSQKPVAIRATPAGG